ncbi:MAG: mechanosensitive ion channel family protein [Bacteroidales bacterium]|nr:mechanosensitive ion channel family protein [Bacteroidales bacterium]
MKRTRKFILALMVAIFMAPSVRAVFNEKNLAQTLKVLRYELFKAYNEMEQRQIGFEKQDERQHEQLVSLIQNCNELSLMLYSQKQDFTFDLTYALQQVTDQYHSFTANRMPYDNIITYFNVEIERYERLVKTLSMLPPSLVEIPDSLGPGMLDSLAMTLQFDKVLPNLSYASQHAHDPDHAGHHHDEDPGVVGMDEEHFGEGEDVEDEGHHHGTFELDSLARQDRDSCVFYASKILKMFTDLRDHMVEDNEHYETTNKRLKDAYDYAQERYKLVQKKIFTDGQRNYWTVIKNFKNYSSRAAGDFRDKYGRDYFNSRVQSEWRGPMVVGFSSIILIYLILAVALSFFVIKILKRRVKVFQTSSFERRELAIIMLAAVVLFVIVVSVARYTGALGTNFFRMASGLLLEYALLLVAILSSILIRFAGNQVNNGLRLYSPVMMLGLLVITFRIIFIPNSLISLLFPPVLLAFGTWQAVAYRNNSDRVPKVDKYFAIASLVVTACVFAMSLAGYSLMGLQVYIWWIFQLILLQLIISVNDLLKKYRRRTVDKLVRAYRMKHFTDIGKDKGAYILVTWFYDLVDMVVVPLLALLSVPFCLFMASKVFDLTEIVMNAFYYPFLDTKFIKVSLYMVIVAVGLYFVFNYLIYLCKSLYRIYKIRSKVSKSATGLLRENEVNLTLANNVIALLGWGAYVITTIVLLKIPTSSLSMVTAGLAAGLGFAMKDILNNFFYGVQLMGGRMRVGDTIECDGIRGTVDSINYQTTTLKAIDGSLIAFPNTTLFSKTFKNLTKSDSYEYVAMPVGVAYGTDVEKARKVIVKALAPLCRPDKFGREMVKPGYGIQITLNDFGDNSVNLMVKQYVLVEQRYNYIAKANELIYKALRDNNIEIPFPQQDVYIKQAPFPGEEK